MIRGGFRIRAIALIAAYAVALQGLLSAFVPVAAALPTEILCSGQSIDAPEPVGYESSCASACAMLGGSAGLLPPHVVIAIHEMRPVHAGALVAPPSLAAPRRSQVARAPPLV